MAIASRVIDHYGTGRPIDRIRQQLVAAGLDLERLDSGVLSGVDEFHLGGRLATTAVLESLAKPNHDGEILDVGCGIGGAARAIATTLDCRVTGIDLTPVFVSTADELSAMLGLGDRTRFDVADATALPFADERFAAVTMLHVGMNIEDKVALFTELARVLTPAGSLHVYDIMRTGPGVIPHPMPWASDETTSFVRPQADYVAHLSAAGLTPGAPVDRSALVREALENAGAKPPPVNLSHLMGSAWPSMFANLRSAFEAGLVAPIEIVATKPPSKR